jgi:hypothetical protein
LRLATAYIEINQAERSEFTAQRGLKLEPDNEQLKRIVESCQELIPGLLITIPPLAIDLIVTLFVFREKN